MCNCRFAALRWTCTPQKICASLLDTLQVESRKRHRVCVFGSMEKLCLLIKLKTQKYSEKGISFSCCKGVGFTQKKGQNISYSIYSLRLWAAKVDLIYQEKYSYLDLVLCLLLVSQAVSSVSHCFLWSTLNVVSGFEFLEDVPLITLNKPRDHFLFRANDCIPFRCVLLSNLMCVNTKKWHWTVQNVRH